MSEIHCNLLVHGKRWQVGGTNYLQVQLGEIFVSTINQYAFEMHLSDRMGQATMCCFSYRLVERTVVAPMKNRMSKGKNWPKFS